MAIPTTRTSEAGRIAIDTERCVGCGLCVQVCKDFSIIMQDGKATVSATPCFGCIGCGHCMAICPRGAIIITGRTLSGADVFDLPDRDAATDFDQLLALLQRRRSIREFTAAAVPEDMIARILQAAQTAPMGLPPSDVHVLVLDSKAKVRAFAQDFCGYLEEMKWFFSDWFLRLMRPVWGKSTDELFRGFVQPLFKVYTENMQSGINLVNYDAPLAMYFYGSPYCDPADPIVAATYAMLAAESLGLGTCMLGGVHPLIQKGTKAARFRTRHNIRHASQEGLFVIFGYPDVQYSRGIRRTFAAIDRP